jgi:hypothetical protein
MQKLILKPSSFLERLIKSSAAIREAASLIGCKVFLFAPLQRNAFIYSEDFMTQHTFPIEYNGKSATILMGWDRPLQGFFMMNKATMIALFIPIWTIRN